MAREFSRTQRVAQQLHKEVASIIQNEYKHRVGGTPLLTVSGVEVSRDLAHAKVFITCYQDSDEVIKEQIKLLNEFKGFIRGFLAKRLRMRAVPHVQFFNDSSVTEGMRISNLVSKVINDDEKRSQSDEDSN